MIGVQFLQGAIWTGIGLFELVEVGRFVEGVCCLLSHRQVVILGLSLIVNGDFVAVLTFDVDILLLNIEVY